MVSRIKCYKQTIKIRQETPSQVRRKSEKKFRLKTELPKLIEKYKIFSPSELKRLILQDYNKDITDKAIIMFFERHPEVKAALLTGINSEAQSQVEVSGDIFKNSNLRNCHQLRDGRLRKPLWLVPLTCKVMFQR